MQQKIVNINLLDQLFSSVVIENAHTTTRVRAPGFVHCIQRRRKGAYLVGAWILHIAHHVDADAAQFRQGDRKSTRLNSSHPSNLVCRLLLEKKNQITFSALPAHSYVNEVVTFAPSSDLKSSFPRIEL